MPTDTDNDPAPIDPAFFENRVLIEVLSWDWALHVGMAPASMPPERRFQGGLLYTRGLEISGRVVAPGVRRGQAVRVWITPVAPDLDFGPKGLREVGQCRPGRETSGTSFEVSLLLPCDALSGAITCLSTVWKYLHLWTTDGPPDHAAISDFAFSSAIPETLLT